MIVPDRAGTDQLLRDAAAAISAGDWRGAETALLTCLERRADDVSLAYNLALVEKRLGKPAQAEQQLARLLATAPDHANARFEYAASLMDRGAETDALGAFETYLAAVPDDPDARLNAARLCLRLGRAEAAAVHLELAESVRPGDPAIRLGRAETARDLGAVDEARNLFGALYRDVPGLRPEILKAMSQGARGRFPLDRRRLG